MKSLRVKIFMTDILALYLSLILAVLVRGVIHIHATQNEAVWMSAHLQIFLPSFLFSILALYIAGLYELQIIYDRTKTIVLLLYTQISTAFFSIISFYILRTSLTPKLTIFLYVFFSIAILSLTRNYVFNTLQKRKKLEAIYIGQDLFSEQNLQKLETNFSPLKFIFSTEILDADKYQYIVYDDKILNPDNTIFLERLKREGKNTWSYNQYYEFLFKKVDLENFNYLEFMQEVGEGRESAIHFLFRKFVDITCGILVFPFFVLSMPFIWFGIYLQDKGMVIFSQDRVGYLGKIIRIYKIRTMTGVDNGGVVDAKKAENFVNINGLTVTKFGMFLRKVRLDELPQCINLLNGNISFIGPRVDAFGVAKDMERDLHEYKLRILVPQGLTGWAQVHMNIQPKTHVEYAERLAYELYYIKYRSILLDISIILKTIKTLISREGA